MTKRVLIRQADVTRYLAGIADAKIEPKGMRFFPDGSIVVYFSDDLKMEGMTGWEDLDQT